MRTFARKAGMTVLCAAALAGYWVASEHGGPYAAAAVTAGGPGPAVHAPRWLSFQHATSADERHFHVHGKCVIETASTGHGWIVCRDGQSRSIPLDSEPARITLVTARTGVALESLRWNSAGKARGQLDCTGEGAGQIGPVRVTVRRDGAGGIESLRLAGNTDGIAKSWTFRNGHWSAS